MEHRLSERVQGKLGLLIYKRGMPVAIGQIRDASRRGVFIATDCSEVQLNQAIEFEFRLPDRQQNPIRKLKAHVVRKTNYGLGVDFDGIDNDELTIASLVEWLDRHYLSRQHFSVYHNVPGV